MTYARWWIVQYVRDYARRMSCFYIPQNIYEKMGKYSKAISKYRQKYGHNPAHEEISEITGLTEKEINMITFLLKMCIRDRDMANVIGKLISCFFVACAVWLIWR